MHYSLGPQLKSSKVWENLIFSG